MNASFDIMGLLPLLIPLVVLQLGLMIYCLVDLARREKVKHLPKWAWALIIIAGELIGPVVYLIIGRGES
jgi:uncharacterized membrane protein